MGEFITPPSLPPTTYCRRLLIPNSPEWIGTVTGALMDLIYPSAWKQTTGISVEEAADRAREMFNLYLNSGNNGDCGDMTCCDDIAMIYRVNPSSGNVEQSTNNGSTWTPAAGGFQSVIVEPIPPVTSGVAVNKCDAATNLYDQVLLWIDQVSGNFDTATTLISFAEGVLIAIVAALVLILSAGALTPIQALVLPTIGAALTAAWSAGKAAFDAYWTTERKDAIRCAAVCNIGENGSFTDAQFSAFWNQCNGDLTPSPAKMLFMGFLSSVGRQGLNAMAATGNNSGADCSDCNCTDLPSIWWNNGDDPAILVVPDEDGVYSVTADKFFAGGYYGTVLFNDPDLGGVFTNGGRIITVTGGATISTKLDRGTGASNPLSTCYAVAQTFAYSSYSWTFTLADYNAC